MKSSISVDTSDDLNYDGGRRYPRLEKTGSGPSSLDALLAPKP